VRWRHARPRLDAAAFGEEWEPNGRQPGRPRAGDLGSLPPPAAADVCRGSHRLYRCLYRFGHRVCGGAFVFLLIILDHPRSLLACFFSGAWVPKTRSWHDNFSEPIPGLHADTASGPLVTPEPARAGWQRAAGRSPSRPGVMRTSGRQTAVRRRQKVAAVWAARGPRLRRVPRPRPLSR